MKKVAFVVLPAVLMCALTYMVVGVGSASAAGFALYEWDNRANGMGGAVIASETPNPSALAYNPAGMTKLEGTQAQMGATLIAPSAHVELQAPTIQDDERSVDVKNHLFVVPHAYATIQVTDNIWLGAGEFTRFGLGTSYDHSWAGTANVYKVSLETFSQVINLAYKWTDSLSVAVGFEYMMGSLDLRSDKRDSTLNGALPVGGASDWKMQTSGGGTSWNLAMLWEPRDWLNVGIVYRDQLRLFSEGPGEWERGMTNLGPAAGAPGSNYEDDLKIRANFPASLALGLGFQVTDDLVIELDFIGTYWSAFESLEYYVTPGTNAHVAEITTDDFESLKMYEDVLRIQLGVEWQALDGVFVRGGYIRDESPQNEEYADYMLPSNDRQLVTTGLGLELGDLTLDLSAMYLWASDSHFNNAVAGTYETDITDSKTWLGGLSVSYAF